MTNRDVAALREVIRYHVEGAEIHACKTNAAKDNDRPWTLTDHARAIGRRECAYDMQAELERVIGTHWTPE